MIMIMITAATSTTTNITTTTTTTHTSSTAVVVNVFMTSRAESVRQEMEQHPDVISADDLTQGISALVRVWPLSLLFFVTWKCNRRQIRGSSSVAGAIGRATLGQLSPRQMSIVNRCGAGCDSVFCVIWCLVSVVLCFVFCVLCLTI